VVDALGARIADFVMVGESGQAGGSGVSCGVRAGGTAWCWILNAGFSDAQTGYGIMGNGRRDTPPAHVVSQVLTSPTTPLTGVTRVSGILGLGVGCAVAGEGVWCWGRGDTGALGNGLPVDSRFAVPVVVNGTGARLTGVRAVAPGWTHTCAARTDGTVWCWGSNWFFVDNRLDGRTAAAVQVQGLIGEAVDVQAGYDVSAALMRDGTIWFWGNNADGNFGDGTTMVWTQPRRTRLPDGSNFDRVTQLRIGNGRNCALRDDGTLWCWGWRQGSNYPVLLARDVASFTINNEQPAYLGRDGRIRVQVGSNYVLPTPCAR
jgi:hypothetical protein